MFSRNQDKTNNLLLSSFQSEPYLEHIYSPRNAHKSRPKAQANLLFP